MDLEVVTVGTELLLGYTLDTNAAYIARQFAAAGVRIVRRTTVADDGDAIRSAVSQGLERARFVLVTGGLGPTRDDVTKKAVAALYDAPLELDEAYLETLRRRFEQLGRGPMAETNRSQALIPRGATVLPNPNGTAPGLWFDGPAGIVVLLPGVPHEMRWLVDHEVVPRCEARLREHGAPPAVTRSLTLRTTGVTESQLAADLAALEPSLAPATLAFLPGFEGVDLRLTAWRLPADWVDEVLGRAAERLRPALGRHHYGDQQTDLAAVVLELLRAAGVRLATAESCTGGLLGARITDVAGSSDVYAGGLVSYADASKVRDLEVPEGLLERAGAVSEPVAEAMARGVCRRFGTEAGIGVTGIAGPGGGSPEKPVGTVCLSARVGGRSRTMTSRLPGDRQAVRARAAQAGLDLVRRLLIDS